MILHYDFICFPHLTDFGAMSADSVDEIAFPKEYLLASRLACSPHLTDFGVCLRIELACLLAGTDLGQRRTCICVGGTWCLCTKIGARLILNRLEDEASLYKDRRNADAKSLEGYFLSDQYKMGRGGAANAAG